MRRVILIIALLLLLCAGPDEVVDDRGQVVTLYRLPAHSVSSAVAHVIKVRFHYAARDPDDEASKALDDEGPYRFRSVHGGHLSVA